MGRVPVCILFWLFMGKWLGDCLQSRQLIFLDQAHVTKQDNHGKAMKVTVKRFAGKVVCQAIVKEGFAITMPTPEGGVGITDHVKPAISQSGLLEFQKLVQIRQQLQVFLRFIRQEAYNGSVL